MMCNFDASNCKSLNSKSQKLGLGHCVRAPYFFYPQTDTFNADGPTVSSICEIESMIALMLWSSSSRLFDCNINSPVLDTVRCATCWSLTGRIIDSPKLFRGGEGERSVTDTRSFWGSSAISNIEKEPSRFFPPTRKLCGKMREQDFSFLR